MAGGREPFMLPKHIEQLHLMHSVHMISSSALTLTFYFVRMFERRQLKPTIRGLEKEI